MAGHFGLAIDPAILKYAEDFGLMLFVYELGLKVGPGFFSSFRTGGLKLNMLGLGLVLAGTATAIALSYILAIPMTDMVGILSGATTNTPSLGAAQQAINQLGLPAEGAAPQLRRDISAWSGGCNHSIRPGKEIRSTQIGLRATPPG